MTMDIHEWIYFSEIDSTSSWIKRNFRTLIPNKTVVRADVQTHGRGRFDRQWESKPGGLYFSIYILPDFEMVSQEALVASFSEHLIGFAKQYFGVQLRMKLPNDVYFEDAKLAGVLIENSFLGMEQEYCIMGIGMNVNQRFGKRKPLNFLNPAVSLSEIMGRELDLDVVLHELLKVWTPTGLGGSRPRSF